MWRQTTRRQITGVKNKVANIEPLESFLPRRTLKATLEVPHLFIPCNEITKDKRIRLVSSLECACVGLFRRHLSNS